MFYLKDDVPRALSAVGRSPEETRHAEGLIRYWVDLVEVNDGLHDQAFSLEQVPTQTELILQGGGALGASNSGS